MEELERDEQLTQEGERQDSSEIANERKAFQHHLDTIMAQMDPMPESMTASLN